MSTMNTFYTRLVNAPEVDDPYQQGLAKLTRADRTQLDTFSVGWDEWAVNPA